MRGEGRYVIRQEKVDELKRGRNNFFIESLTTFSRQYISEIFLGKRILDDRALERFLVPICEEVTLLKKQLETDGLEKTKEYFFKKV